MNKKIKVLHLEDNPNDAMLIHEMLHEGGIEAEIVVVDNKEDFQKNLLNKDFDLVLSDFEIPGYGGIEALREAAQKRKGLPFIFCSGTIGEELAVECLQVGAMDYVLKHKLQLLVPAINRAFRLVKEMKQREETELQLKKVMLAVENTHDAIFITEPDGKIVYVNPHFTEMYGWDPEEVLNKATPNILKSDKHSAELYQFIMDSLAKKNPIKLELINKTRGGSLVEALALFSPIVDSGGQLVGYFSIQTDISTKKEQEREILWAKKEAEEMNKLKTYFLSNVSHEFRTPLVSILGFSEVLMNELENPDHIDILKFIHDGGTRLQKTLDDVLLLTEVEKKKIEFSKQKFDLVKFVEALGEDCRRSAKEKSLGFKLFLEKKEIEIDFDQELLKTAIKNILDNAVKFTSKGDISLSLSTKLENENKVAEIIINDSGKGISEEQLKKIFLPFRQGSEGFSRTHEGLGLGLSISKQILDLLKGEIKINSHVQKGTQVVIKIPVVQSESEIAKKIVENKIRITSQFESITTTLPSVLLVEDNPGNKYLFKKYLEKTFAVDATTDGITAVAMAEIKKYDLILMDINLGSGIDGVEAFTRIRKLPNCAATPTVALTAYALNRDEQKYLDHGFDAYAVKPISQKDLLAVMNRLLHHG